MRRSHDNTEQQARVATLRSRSESLRNVAEDSLSLLATAYRRRACELDLQAWALALVTEGLGAPPARVA